MTPIACALIAFVTTLLRSRLSRQIDIVALRHQLGGLWEINPTATHPARGPHPVLSKFWGRNLSRCQPMVEVEHSAKPCAAADAIIMGDQAWLPPD